MKADRLFTETRRAQIIAIIQQQKSIYVEAIVEQFGVSAVTVRKDLKALEDENVLTRTHGGAILNDKSTFDPPLVEKQKIRTAEKMAIARQAARLVNEGDVIILDNGSTSTFIGRELKNHRKLTIITNAVNIAWELAGSPVEIILTGGSLRAGSFSLLGPLAEASLTDMSANKYFMSVDGIDMGQGFTTPNLQETRMSQLMMRAAAEVIVVADSSKFGQRRMSVIAPLTGINRLITDAGLPDLARQTLLDTGIDLIVV